VINPGPDERVVHGKDSVDFAFGDVISFQQSGAGGYGDPWTREPDRVLVDVLDGYVSVGHAREAYGVVIDPTTMTVDGEATRRLRMERP
jgi:N-methylhydantoinase B